MSDMRELQTLQTVMQKHPLWATQLTLLNVIFAAAALYVGYTLVRSADVIAGPLDSTVVKVISVVLGVCALINGVIKTLIVASSIVFDSKTYRQAKSLSDEALQAHLAHPEEINAYIARQRKLRPHSWLFATTYSTVLPSTPYGRLTLAVLIMQFLATRSKNA